MKIKLITKKIKSASTRDGYGKGLVEIGRKNEKVVVLSADLKDSTRCKGFAEEFPERFVQVGVAEQNMAGLAAGMAMQGYIPFISSFAVFSPGRNWDQIRSSICYPNLNVKICSTHAGISTGQDGATHQSLEDIALTRVLPNMIVISPCDAIEAKKATIAIGKHYGPSYLRLSRNESQIITSEKDKFEIGKANVLLRGNCATIIACGTLLHEAIQAAKILSQKHKIKPEVINCHTIKPLDIDTIARSAEKTGFVVCIEEHQASCGLGSAIAEALAVRCPVPIRFVGMPDCFGESGNPEELLEKYGMTREKIVSSVLDVLKHGDNF